MPYANSDGVKLYYEEAGTGTPIIFVHEFAADWRSWEAQVRHFSRHHRCVAYSARGYTGSDVPDDQSLYSWRHFADDIGVVMDHLHIDRAYVVGLSMGAYAALQFGLRQPDRVIGLVLAGVGSGSPPDQRPAFMEQTAKLADMIEAKGAEGLVAAIAEGPTRVQLQNKDPRGFDEFVRNLAEHPARGSAYTMRNYQGQRPSLTDFTEQLAAMTLPVLIAVGDEDEPCIETSLFLRRTIPASGLWMAPRTAHGMNLEEPAAFNDQVEQFINAVQIDKWGPRDPRSRGNAPMPLTGRN
ncbi:MAG: alpha/beta hydrolase [Minwuia sp.]|nr:alpha/beta hydrolase [Minwuia sp.]